MSTVTLYQNRGAYLKEGCYLNKDIQIVSFHHLRKTLFIVAAQFHRKQAESPSENLSYMMYSGAALELRKMQIQVGGSFQNITI